MGIRTTTLHIKPQLTQQVIKSSGISDSITKEVCMVLVWRNRNPHTNLCKISNLSSSDNLVIEVEDSSTWSVKSLYLWEELHTWINRYFQNNKNAWIQSDCLWFIAEVLWWNQWSRCVDDGEYTYEGGDFISTINTLSPGEIISLSDWTQEGWDNGKYHYALYLGYNLFLSKLGKPWVFAVTNFEQLKDLYPRLVYIVKLLLKRKK